MMQKRLQTYIATLEAGAAYVTCFVRKLTGHERGHEEPPRANSRAVWEYEQLLEKIAMLAQKFGSARDLMTIYRALLDFTLSSMPCSMLFISLYEEERGVRNGVYVWYDGDERDASYIGTVQVGDGPAGRAIKTGKVIISNDYLKSVEGKLVVSAGFDEDPRKPQSALVAPMVIMGRSIGAVEVQCYEVGAYAKEHVTALRMAANLAANAIENVRLLELERAKEEQLRQSQKMEAVGKLAGGVAHDFNNLLTAIIGYTDLSLRRLEQSNPLYSNLEEIKQAGNRAASLTRQLLAFSRKQVLQPKVIDLNHVVFEMNRMLHRLIGEDVEILLKLAHGAVQVKADQGQIEQVILNLAVNARDSMPAGGKLIVETASVYLDHQYASRHVSVVPGHYALICVTDTGCGMDAKTQERIFEPFFTTKEVNKGTGLGLSTVYGIVKQSGGNIWVYSEVGQGTTFKIYLPLAEQPAQKHEAQVNHPEVVAGTETILLVEDDAMVRSMAREILNMNGYQVLVAENGHEAITICEQYSKPIHLMLTDVVMPKMSGRELTARVMQIRPQVPVLYMSGYTDDAIIHHGLLDKGTAFIEKPFTSDLLARKIREILDAEVKA